MKKAAIFDIDGTLSDCSHRQHFLEGGKKDWKGFFENAKDDMPIQPILNLLKILHQQDSHLIILCTGRGEEIRALTEAWLKKYEVPYSRLMMRASGDRRQDSVVKQEMLDVIGATEVDFVVDDRRQAVEMWRKNGLICLQCAEGNF